MEILTQNTKLRATSKELGVKVMNFGIPAYRSRVSGKVICPFAKDCVKYCYAQKGAYNYGNVHPVFEKRYELTKQDNFVDLMCDEINEKKPKYIRVHDSGDYYSNAYIDKWFEIARRNPDVRFYSYTKSIPLFEGRTIPHNYSIIYSEGSKVDELIDTNVHRHAKIFKDKESLTIAGYVDASKIDLYATKWYSQNHKIGLIFH